MFWSKVFTTRNDIVVAICDEKLIEKKIKTNQFDLKISKNFYGENVIDEDIALKLLKRATIANLMGENIVGVAEKNGFISKENIILIDDIPHAQFVKI